ncbi:uncharacterized protein PV09_04281 [Verruconis gallopava]|uniref:D-isomer specific 2-hydroxyacid dehydrogenase NAD-binding domain-containing protein n=1 Tax=Verruconis gallopava TaxID=253628 RepID=A0A0D1YV66_9PEZI|nr:uncharacterized protein PV09_04281 [Verruconis gallopava]KIW04527.1 hypothetical protein PV09_04281 [Verruconis gallopava]
MTAETEYILIILPVSEPVASVDALRHKFPQAKVVYHFAQAPASGAFDSDKIWTNVTILVTLFHVPSSIKDAPRLRLVHLASSGVNHLIGTAIYDNPSISITSSSGCASPQIAEWVMMTALITNWDYHYLHEKQQNRRWVRTSSGRDAHMVRNLVGQKLGIVGYGSIGRQVARNAKAMGMVVLAYTATPKSTPESRRDSGYIVPGTGDPSGEIPSAWYHGGDKASLHEFLAQDLDMLVLCVPSTKETTGLLGKTELEILCSSGRKPLLANVSRGTAIEQDALVEALRNGSLRGAALDVSDPEPLPSHDPLWDAHNVIIHPHISAGGMTDVYLARVFDALSQNISKLQGGERLLNQVNRKAGY